MCCGCWQVMRDALTKESGQDRIKLLKAATEVLDITNLFPKMWGVQCCCFVTRWCVCRVLLLAAAKASACIHVLLANVCSSVLTLPRGCVMHCWRVWRCCLLCCSAMCWYAVRCATIPFMSTPFHAPAVRYTRRCHARVCTLVRGAGLMCVAAIWCGRLT